MSLQLRCLTSALGQKRNLSVGPFLSAFGPKADIQTDIADSVAVVISTSKTGFKSRAMNSVNSLDAIGKPQTGPAKDTK